MEFSISTVTRPNNSCIHSNLTVGVKWTTTSPCFSCQAYNFQISNWFHTSEVDNNCHLAWINFTGQYFIYFLGKNTLNYERSCKIFRSPPKPNEQWEINNFWKQAHPNKRYFWYNLFKIEIQLWHWNNLWWSVYLFRYSFIPLNCFLITSPYSRMVKSLLVTQKFLSILWSYVLAKLWAWDL